MEPGVAPGWRVPEPDAAMLVHWLADFGTRFTIFIDVEEEFDWTQPFSRAARSVEAVGALPEFHDWLRGEGGLATYLVDHPIATDPRAIEVLRPLVTEPGFAIGTQLHPWVNPPFADGGATEDSFVGNLPTRLAAAKLDRLTAAIADAFDLAPRAFRAGRYGIGAGSAAMLVERGYRLDSSMRARHDYSALGGPDFSAISSEAFRIGPGGRLIELPLTTVYTGVLRQRGSSLHRRAGGWPRGRGMLARTGLLSRVPLTPEGTPLDEAREAIRIAVDTGLRVLNFSFHSPSLVPGNTPYVRDAADLSRFRRWWAGVIGECDRLGVRAASLDHLIAAAG